MVTCHHSLKNKKCHTGSAAAVTATAASASVGELENHFSNLLLYICWIGTDIEDFKCSWLVVKALEICNEEQKKVLYVRLELFLSVVLFLMKFDMVTHLCYALLPGNYGKPDPANVAKVKALFFRSYFSGEGKPGQVQGRLFNGS
ncbi:hypothetical protein J1N35_029446 [Gossypium stocksii]|uniref:Uncharacterized protein n=1 Tax=Gossypium stocksii TaxID=47602 RepID=A0A9D3V027_9ROSI|nr:hypothetical protein J1N35_029446 [Gossypium stocksii]